MPHQGEMELLRRVRAHTFIIEETGPDVVRVIFRSAREVNISQKVCRLARGHDGGDHDTEYVFGAHNRAHTIKDEERRKDRMKETELHLPNDIPLEHQQ